MPGPIRCVVITASDRCSRGEATDTSGPGLAALARERLGAEVVHTACLPDDMDRLAAVFVEWSAPAQRVDLVLVTGGTGLSPRDVTPEALRRVMDREHEGLMDLARLRCLERTARAFLSRGIAGTIGRTLVVTLPGSPRGSSEMFEAMADILPHAVETLRGEA